MIKNFERLSQHLLILPDFYLEIKWKFDSFMPLV